MTVNTKKGWFKVPGIREEGDRTLEEQLLGLKDALGEAHGKTVLDLGSAEGLISLEFAKAGAAEVVGVEVLEHHLQVARQVCKDEPRVRFVQAHLDDLIKAEGRTPRQYDIVLALAIVHKLYNPADGLRFSARSARSLVVFRFPHWMPSTGWLASKRSQSGVDVPKEMAKLGFKHERTCNGPRLERVQYWRRV